MSTSWVIVFGNIKGGTGKSTLALHVAIALLYQNYTVATVDMDGHQGTLSRYLENRKIYCTREKKTLPIPTHLRLSLGFHEDITPAQQQLQHFIKETKADVVLIDTGGNDSFLSRYAHTLADILVTPMNDSFIDLDVLVNVQSQVPENQLPLSTYASMIWEQRMKKAAEKSGSIEWIVVRNRMHSVVSRNRLQMEKILEALSKRIGFHLAGGLGERVIFRELFDSGLTLLDKQERHTSLSHIAARQELRALIQAILKLRDKLLSKTA